jgi:hypothetical protein
MTAYEGHVGTCPLDETERGRRKRKGWGMVLCLLLFFICFLSLPMLLHSFFHVAGNCSSSGSVASMNLITGYTKLEVGLRTGEDKFLFP